MAEAGVSAVPMIGDMLEELRAAPQIYAPSAFWEHYSELNLGQLDEAGFAEFKRTVNRNYFQWLVTSVSDPQFRAAVSYWRRHPTLAPLAASLDEPLERPPDRLGELRRRVRGRTYAFYIGMLWDYVRRRDRFGILGRLEEPALGHPQTVRHRGRSISEDLCNSALEYIAIAEALPEAPPGVVIELGAGYGRLAWLFLEALPHVRYVVVDIPPALAIAQRYLTELFPARRIFPFRPFRAAAEVAAELARAQLAFFTPNQLELVAPLEADLFVNVSSLHEMRSEQIAHYFGLIERHTAGCFYTKQWLRSVNPHDQIEVRREDYPVPPRWRAIFDRVHPIQTHFFEALYALST